MTATSEEAHLLLCKRDPMWFRNNLIMDGPNGPERWGNFMCDFQIADFKAIDEGLKYLCGYGPYPSKQRFWIQRSRGSSKTTDFASSMIYVLFACPRKLEAIVCAEDRDQALFIREQMLKILQYNDWLYEFIDVQAKRIINKVTNATLLSLSRDVSSSFGLTPEIVIGDEFTHWTQPTFWSSVYSSFNKTSMRGGMMLIGCNAGVGTGWQWDVRETARTSDKWYFSSPPGYAPWFREEDIEDQRKIIPASEYRRLWLNEWQASAAEFVSEAEADACTDSTLIRLDETPNPDWGFVASIDYAEKKDRTVGTVGYRYGDEIRIARQDVIDPTKTESGVCPVSWCEDWMRRVYNDFGGANGKVTFVLDRWQMLYVIEKLRNEGFDIQEFEFQSGIGNWELSVILRGLILHKRLRWYPNCGQILDSDGRAFRNQKDRDDLVSELYRLKVKKLPAKRWRIDHDEHGHDDRAFGVGAICHYIVINSEGLEGWEITEPIVPGQFQL